MDRDNTLDIVHDIRRRMDDCTIGIRWPSNEMLSSAVDRRSRRRGSGDDHDSLKEYEPGDDLRQVDHMATAAAGDPDSIYVRTFYEPKVMRFNVLLDVNPSMNFGTKGTLKSRLAALCAACGIYSAVKMKDRVSYVNYAAEPVTIRKNQGGTRVLTDFLIHAIEDGPEAMQAELESGGGLDLAFSAIRRNNRSLVLVVSDFVNMSEDDWEALRVSGFKNDTVAVFVQDLRERELPEVPWPGASYTFEDYRGKEKTIWVTPDDAGSWFSRGIAKIMAKLTRASEISSRKQYRENFQKHADKVLDRLESFGVKTVVVSTEDEENAVRDLLRLLANKVRSL